eukprot:8716403-Karenia_brevis.AAC.1
MDNHHGEDQGRALLATTSPRGPQWFHIGNEEELDARSDELYKWYGTAIDKTAQPVRMPKAL